MAGRLEGRTAFVTGGAGGIGRAVAGRFAAEGARVVAADVAPWNDPPEGVVWVGYDVTSELDARATFEELETHWGGLDVLVNAAGTALAETVEGTSLEAWTRLLEVNATGTFLASKHALPLLRRAAAPAIVNVGAHDAILAPAGRAAFAAAAGAVHALTRAMAVDHGAEGIRVNAVCPAFVETPMLETLLPGGTEWTGRARAVRDAHPLGRIAAPEDVAGLVLWLASEEARHATGQLWVLDGGLTAAQRPGG